MYSISISISAFDQFRRIATQFPESKNELIRCLKKARELLGIDPLGCSESRQDRERICIESPLTFYFSIDFQQSTVEISQVYFNSKS